MSRPGASTRRRAGRGAALWAGLLLSVLLGAALFLRSPIERELVVPPGADTPAHLWRAKVAAAASLRSLFDSSPFDFQVNPDRVGLPVLASVLSAVGVSPWRLMFVTPALAAALLAVAGWAFARAAGEPAWASPIFAAAAVVSVPFALTTRSYLDNALADGLIVAAAAALLWAADRPGAGGLVAALLAGSLLMHWAVGGLFLAVAILFAMLLVPGSLRRLRDGDGWWSTPSGRLTAAIGAGVVVGAVPLLLTPGGNLPDRGTGRYVHGNVARLLPRYRWPTIGAAGGLVAGVVRSVRERGPIGRTTLLLVAWLLPAAVATLLYVAGADLPLMRFLGASMALPLLAAVLLVWLVTWSSRMRSPFRAPVVPVVVALVAGVLLVSASAATETTDGSSPSISADELPAIRAAVDHADRGDASQLVIVVSRDPGRAFRRVRMLAPARLIPRIGVFQGEPEALFDRAAAAPEPLPPGLEGVELKNAALSADGVARMRVGGAVAMSLEPFTARFPRLAADPENREVAEGVLVLGNADVVPAGAVPPIAPPPAVGLVRDAAVAFAVLLLAGLGWSVALVPAGWDVRAALAPCLGLSGILVAGTIAGLAGLSLGGTTGLIVLVIVAAAGAAAATGSIRLARTAGPRPSETP